jgi:hypothetical protein
MRQEASGRFISALLSKMPGTLCYEGSVVGFVSIFWSRWQERVTSEGELTFSRSSHCNWKLGTLAPIVLVAVLFETRGQIDNVRENVSSLVILVIYASRQTSHDLM